MLIWPRAKFLTWKGTWSERAVTKQAVGSWSFTSSLKVSARCNAWAQSPAGAVEHCAVKPPPCSAFFFFQDCQLFLVMLSIRLAPVVTQSLRSLFVLTFLLPFPPQAMSPEDQFDQQTAQSPFGLLEPHLEAGAILRPTKITPVPKPRTQAGKPQESRGSSERQPLSASTAEAIVLPPQNAPFAPKVPPRRKKSAPAAFHLQVLQSSDSPLFSGSLFNSNNNNNPGSCPHTHGPAPSAPTASAGPANSTTQPLAPSVAELMGKLQGPSAPASQHPQRLDTSSLPENTNLLDLDIHSSFPLSTQAPSATSENLNHPNVKDFSHWVTFSDDEDSSAVADGFNKLLVLEQNKNTLMKRNTDLEL